MILKKSQKDIIKTIQLILPAQNASANSMLNAILGQAGVNSFEFNKKFTELSKSYEVNVILSVQVLVFIDKTFEVIIKGPSITYLLNEEVFFFNKKFKLSEDELPSVSNIGLSKVYEIAFFFKTSKFIREKFYFKIYC